MTDTAGTSNDEHPYHELIQQFKEICAVDDALAAACIEQADGNLQNAIVRFLSGEGIPEPEEEPPQEIPMATHNEIRRRNVLYDNSSASSSVPSTSTTPLNRLPPADNTWSAWFNRILALPFHLFYYSIRQIFAFAFGLFGGLFPAITSPEEDVQTFKSEIETKYSDVECPLNWHHSTYADALKEAKTSVRFLLVYLHNPSHQSTEGFIREKLCTQDFKNFLEQNGMLIWGTNVKTNEGYKVAQALHEQNYPSLLLICMRDNRLACVQKLSGDHPLENLLAALQQGVAQNQRFLNAILNERAQRELNNRLRREQEEEYERSLQEDRKKVQERRRLESEHLENQKREEDELKEIEAKKQRLADIRQRLRKEIENLPEPVNDIVRVSVRFPCGSKFDRRFGATDSLEILFNTVIAHEKCPEDFSLLSSYPRKELTCAPDWYKEYGTVAEQNGEIPTFKEAGLDSSVVVLVKDNQA
uniref:UBX domain-containing protein n=1 Tax=Panagrolaimus sp. ES5 TaxID=591445 RepID=A0AC34GU83_9BILA